MSRRILSLIVIFSMVITMMPASAFATGGTDGTSGTGEVEINKENFPDESFRNYVLGETIDKNQDGKLSAEEIAEIISIEVDGKQINSLKGVEYFREITHLNCSDNYISEIDLSANTKLSTLNCTYNNISELKLSKNTALVNLNCSSNNISEIDLSANTDLSRLDCSNNKISKLDLNANTALGALNCSDNKISTLDLSKQSKLGMTGMGGLTCSNNQLVSIKCNANALSHGVICENNDYIVNSREINVDDLLGFDKTKASNFAGGKLEEGKIIINSDSDHVTYNYSIGNKGNNTVNLKLTYAVEINETNFPDGSFRWYILQNFDKNSQDGKLSGNEIEAVTSIDVFDKSIKSLKGIENFINLNNLNCGGNQITSLDVSKNTKSTDLVCYLNSLTSLNIDNNSELTNLNCSNNKIRTLNLSENTKLNNLDCSNNNISTLDLSANAALQPTESLVNCSNNKLVSIACNLNVSMAGINCYDNNYIVNSREINVADLPGFDADQANITVGGKFNENKTKIIINPESKFVTYNYNIGDQKNTTVNLKITFIDWKDPTYEWADDGSSCTATRINKDDTNQKETATADETAITSEQTKAPTCTEKGETTYTATFEGTDWATTQTTIIANIDTIPHTLVNHPAKEPTYSAAGNIEYWECSVCKKKFSDDAGNTEVSNVEIPKKVPPTPEITNPEAPTVPEKGANIGMNQEQSKNSKTAIEETIKQIETNENPPADFVEKAIQDAVKDCKQVIVEVKTKLVEEKDVRDDSAVIKKALDETLGKGTVEISQYMNIDLETYIDSNFVGNLTETKKPLEFTIQLPMDAEGDYGVARIHNGKVDILAKEHITFDPVKKTLTFITDKFSTYVTYRYNIKPEQVQNVNVDTDNGILKVTFDKVARADKYKVYIRQIGNKGGWRWYNGNSEGTMVKKLYKKSLVKNGKYQVKVIAINGAGNSEASDIKTAYANRIGTKSAKMYAPKFNSITFKNGTAKVVAKKVYVKNKPKNLEYKVSFRVKGTKKWKSAGYSARNVKYIKGLKKGRVYNFALRYRYQSDVDGKTMVYSEVTYKSDRRKY